MVSDLRRVDRAKLAISIAVIFFFWLLIANAKELRVKEAELLQQKDTTQGLLETKERLEYDNQRLQKESQNLEKDRDEYKGLYEKEKQANAIKPKLAVQNANLAVVAYSGGSEQWRAMVAKYFPQNQVDYALKIMACESGGNPQQVNWGDARITGMPSNGLFQINSVQNWAWSNPETNIQRAFEMWSRRGWQPWSCRWKVS